ncbi:hypothetical protein CSUI_007990 [Cystoisospora suis]|uniref:Uncharacterized protein n=1 Tax=Cystoisospora suis TaxID=483139 RepID=A0A2C6KP62_9APIC|nr:hypothetical protein CSUI_007990 [Cystoisospora suis]
MPRRPSSPSHHLTTNPQHPHSTTLPTVLGFFPFSSSSSLLTRNVNVPHSEEDVEAPEAGLCSGAGGGGCAVTMSRLRGDFSSSSACTRPSSGPGVAVFRHPPSSTSHLSSAEESQAHATTTSVSQETESQGGTPKKRHRASSSTSTHKKTGEDEDAPHQNKKINTSAKEEEHSSSSSSSSGCEIGESQDVSEGERRRSNSTSQSASTPDSSEETSVNHRGERHEHGHPLAHEEPKNVFPANGPRSSISSCISSFSSHPNDFFSPSEGSVMGGGLGVSDERRGEKGGLLSRSRIVSATTETSSPCKSHRKTSSSSSGSSSPLTCSPTSTPRPEKGRFSMKDKMKMKKDHQPSVLRLGGRGEFDSTSEEDEEEQEDEEDDFDEDAIEEEEEEKRAEGRGGEGKENWEHPNSVMESRGVHVEEKKKEEEEDAKKTLLVKEGGKVMGDENKEKVGA